MLKIGQILLLSFFIFSIDIKSQNMEQATFGAGCFWCIEAIFDQIEGVDSVASGYMGGSESTANYEDVCSGKTDHAEVIHILYDSSKVSYEKLLEVLFTVHDPTTLNRQGNDKGPQYRSVIFYHSEAQKLSAQKVIAQLDSANIWQNKIVTEVTQARTFYKAESYHQDYYNGHQEQPYCNIVITPKVEKFKKTFSDLVKQKVMIDK